MTNTDTNPNQAAAEAAKSLEGMSSTKIKATVWKRLAQAELGEEDANEAFIDIVEGAVDDLRANTATTVGISSGVFDGKSQTSDEISPGVFDL